MKIIILIIALGDKILSPLEASLFKFIFKEMKFKDYIEYKKYSKNGKLSLLSKRKT
jgi:hypothetical protein